MPTWSTLQPQSTPTPLVALELAKKHLRVDHDDDDGLIAAYLSAAADWIESYLGSTLLARQYRWVVSEEKPTGMAPFISLPFPITVYPLWYPWPDFGGVRPLEIPRGPIVSVDSLSYGQWGQADTTIDPSFYDVDGQFGRIRLHGGAVPTNRDYLNVLFTAGYANATSLPPSMVASLLLLLGHLYENRGDTPTEAPTAVRLLLTPYRRVTFGA